VRALDDGRSTALTVRAQPGARHTGFAGFWNGLPKIAVSAPAQDGRANAQMALVIAELFGLRPSAVEQTSGARSRRKSFRLACAPDVVNARLEELERAEEES
jgi:uncharacterized protein YggU (UPF0235/DUF167 family)